MSRGRMSFAPDVCVKGKALFERIGGNISAPGPTPLEARPGGGSGRKFATSLERWAAETSLRFLDVKERDPELFDLLSGRREAFSC